MIKKVIAVVLVVIVLGALIPVLFPMMLNTQSAITGNITGEDAGSLMIVAFWPILLIIIGIGIAAALIFYALRKFGVIKRR